MQITITPPHTQDELKVIKQKLDDMIEFDRAMFKIHGIKPHEKLIEIYSVYLASVKYGQQEQS